jgi:antitoxin PrlF
MRLPAMTTLTITSKGQVTFKKELLKHLDSKPGDQLDVTLLPGGKLEVKAAPSGKIEGFIGALEGKTRKVASIEEIGTAAARGWAGKQR